MARPVIPLDRLSRVARAFLITLVLNAAVAAAKIIYGIMSGCLSMTADGFHSTLDGSSNVVGLVAIRMAKRPPDRRHPYGHHKFEAVAAMTISFLMFATAWHVGEEVVHRLREEGLGPIVTQTSFLVMLLTLTVNVFVYTYERRVGRETSNQLLLADSQHTLSDILVSCSVIVSLVVSKVGYPQADLVVGIIVMGAVARVAYGIIMSSLGVLADAAAIDPGLAQSVASDVPGVVNAHKIRTRGLQDRVYIDLHVQVDPEMHTHDSHDVAHRVEEALRERIPGIVDVTVHVEPAADPPGEATNSGLSTNANGTNHL